MLEHGGLGTGIPLLASKKRMKRSSCPLSTVPSMPLLEPVALWASSSVLPRFGSEDPRPLMVATTALTPVADVPSYVSRLAMPMISSAVRVSYMSTEASA